MDSKLGVIQFCQGASCPTPCCQKQVFIFPEELKFVIASKELQKKLTNNYNKEQPDNIFLSHNKCYLNNCFNKGCFFEKGQLNIDNEFQKPFICILFPFQIINKNPISGNFINLELVPRSLCPLVENNDIIKNHFHDTIVPVIKIRFKNIKYIKFDNFLSELIGGNEFYLYSNTEKI